MILRRVSPRLSALPRHLRGGAFFALLSCLALPAVATAQFEQESVYDLPPINVDGNGYNEGAVSLGVDARYVTDYVFRGIEIVEPTSSEDAANIQIQARIDLDLGKLPNPFIQVFTNSAEGDDVSNFQVIRPMIGLHWETEGFSAELGLQTFTYPDRDALDTSEVFFQFKLNDGGIFNRDDPVFGPYAFVAYDYDAFDGIYAEAGLDRTIPIEDTNFTLDLNAHVGFVDGYEALYSIDLANPASSGFSHYQIQAGLGYDVNKLLNISRRYGQWSVKGTLAFTDGIDDDINASSQLWGGFGLEFRY